MCMVSINVDEAALRDMRPEIDSTAAIRLWAQELIDLRLREMREQREESQTQFELSREASEFDESQMRANDDDTMSIEEARKMTHQAVHEVYAMPDRDMTPDELYDVIAKEIDYIYAQG